MGTLVIVTGYIDSDVRVASPNGKKVANFRVNDGSGWTSVAAWEEVADRVPPKGAHVVIHGRLSTRSYDKTVGGETVKMYQTEVVASMIEQVAGPATASSPASSPARSSAPSGNETMFSD